MHPTMTQVHATFERNASLMLKGLADVTSEHEFERPGGQANSLNFITGHITLYRYTALSILGEHVEQPWADLYGRGSQIQADDAYPRLSDIIEKFTPTDQMIADKLETMSEDDLLKKPVREFPGFEPSVRGSVSFLARHESYHLGQIGLVLRIYGYDQLIG